MQQACMHLRVPFATFETAVRVAMVARQTPGKELPPLKVQLTVDFEDIVSCILQVPSPFNLPMLTNGESSHGSPTQLHKLQPPTALHRKIPKPFCHEPQCA